MSVLKKIKFHPKKKDRHRKIKNFRLVGKAKAYAGAGPLRELRFPRENGINTPQISNTIDIAFIREIFKNDFIFERRVMGHLQNICF